MAVNDIVMSAAGASGPATFVEDVFSNWLYTGNGSTRSITNDIDLSGKGGLTWLKARSTTFPHILVDTARGATKTLQTNANYAEQTGASTLTAFNSNGFSLGNDSDINFNNATYASWSFRKQPKFFDIVTGTADSSGNVSFNHSLGVVPGFVIIKSTTNASDWYCYHRSLGDNYYIRLNLTNAAGTYSGFAYTPTATTFSATIGFGAGAVGYVAYLFAHNAGGFGATGTDNVISCGSFTTDGSGNATVNLGYEPQWVMWKASDTTGDWRMLDNMRGWTTGGNDAYLSANLSDAEAATNFGNINSTGFTVQNLATATHIYIAIRRPMKTPTTGTSVFNPNTSVSTLSSGKFGVTTGFPVDALFWRVRGTVGATYQIGMGARLIGGKTLDTTTTAAEASTIVPVWTYNTQIAQQAENAPVSQVFESFRRAAGFFDVVCYTGTGSLTGVPHNLGVTPELKIIKRRNFATDWIVGGSIIGENGYLFLDTTAALTSSSNYWDGGDDSATVFSVRNTNSMSDSSGGTYVAYLFATVDGVSKVGSYTGNGSSQTINCSFTTGARFVMIKRTDSSGDWYVWDSARGIVAGNDPHLSLNTTAAEVTTDDSVDADSSGFIVNQDAATNINVSSATYIYLAIA